MKVLITGACGFVGPYVAASLTRMSGDEVSVLATGRTSGDRAESSRIHPLDVTDRESVVRTISGFDPTHVIHLAGIAAPVLAGANPRLAWQVHVEGTLNIAEALLEHAPACTLINAGSGLVYGESANSGHPLDELALLAPADSYGVTKAAADLALGAMSGAGLRCVRFRPFNHTGPGQGEAFVVPGFAMQIARIEAGLAPPVIKVGNLEAERDFLDVRDVAEAYVLAVRNSGSLAPGTIINLASGKARRIRDILEMLLDLSTTGIRVEQDRERMRPSDIPRYAGEAGRAKDLLGWMPRHDFAETVRDVLADCRRRVLAAGK